MGQLCLLRRHIANAFRVEEYDMELYRRLYAFAMSNCVSEEDDEGTTNSLLPLVDLINYSPNNSNARLVFEDDCVKVVSTEEIHQVNNHSLSPHEEFTQLS